MRRTQAQRKVATTLMSDPDAQHYGYPLSKNSGVRSGVLYPLLSRWEAAGLIASDWAEPDGSRPRRRYYTLTPAGRTELAALLEETP